MKEKSNKNHDNDTKYYEKRAQLTLLQCFDNIYSRNLIMLDKPDIFDNDNNFGIEVTKALSKKESEIIGLFAQYKDKKPGEMPLKTIEYLEKLGANISIPNNKFYSCTTFNWDLKKSIEVSLENAFKEKIKKLNNGNYAIREKYDLYIFSPSFGVCDLSAVQNFLSNAYSIQENSKLKFRYIYIDDESTIYQCDMTTNKIIPFINDKVHQICEDAKKYTSNN